MKRLMIFDHEQLFLRLGVVTHLLASPFPPALVEVFSGRHENNIVNLSSPYVLRCLACSLRVAVGDVSINPIPMLIELGIIYTSSITQFFC